MQVDGQRFRYSKYAQNIAKDEYCLYQVYEVYLQREIYLKGKYFKIQRRVKVSQCIRSLMKSNKSF